MRKRPTFIEYWHKELPTSALFMYAYTLWSRASMNASLFRRKIKRIYYSPAAHKEAKASGLF